MKTEIPTHSISPGSDNSAKETPVNPPSDADGRDRFIRWGKLHLSDYSYTLLLAIVVGAAAGVAAFFFKWIIGVVANVFTSRIVDGKFNWWLIIVPVVGIVLTGIFTRYVIHTNLTHGCAQLIADLKRKAYKLRHNIAFSPIVGGTITLGFGGSSGSEGPIAYTGAGIGSLVGQWLRVSPAMLKTLIACGASGAIAGIFMSPVGGLMFSLELLGMELASLSVIAVTVSCFVAYGVVYICRGFIFDHTYCPTEGFDLNMLPLVVGLGIFCGLYCLYYSSIMNGADPFYKGIKNPWVRNIVGGLATGICLCIFPSLYGVGYPVIGEIIHGHYDALTKGSILAGMDLGSWSLMIGAAGILLLKCWACGSTNSSGGVGGDFSPTLFAGAVAGFLFACICNRFFGCNVPIGVFAFLGMAGVMAGAIEAPLMTIFITMDLGQSYDFAVPIGVCAIVAYLTVKGGVKVAGWNHHLVRHLKYFLSEEDLLNSRR